MAEHAGPAAIGVFPARAGMSRSRTLAVACGPGFPRTRGDEPGDLAAAWDKPVFSPHARG